MSEAVSLNQRCGTFNRYVFGCRCDLCAAAWRIYKASSQTRRRKVDTRMLVDAGQDQRFTGVKITERGW
jgi:hypothetical protein